MYTVKNKFKRSGCFIVLLLFWCHAAATCTGLACTCGVTATTLAFGSYSPLGGPAVDSSNTITVTCTALLNTISASYTVALNRGSAASFDPRQMQNGANVLNYNIYTTVAHSTIWGDGTSSTVTQAGSCSSVIIGSCSSIFTGFGNIPAGQNTTVPGSYSDTITVTITF